VEHFGWVLAGVILAFILWYIEQQQPKE